MGTMNLFSSFERKMNASRFKRNDLHIIELIQAELIHNILHDFVKEGWELAPQFDTPQCLSSQGQCIIRRGQSTLIFTLKLDSLGTIEGPARIIKALAHKYNLIALTAPSH